MLHSEIVRLIQSIQKEFDHDLIDPEVAVLALLLEIDKRFKGTHTDRVSSMLSGTVEFSFFESNITKARALLNGNQPKPKQDPPTSRGRCDSHLWW